MRRLALTLCCLLLLQPAWGEPEPKLVRAVKTHSSPSIITVTAKLDRHMEGTFMVDTGSTYSAITPDTARRLGIDISDNTPRVRILTINGPVQVPKVVLPSLSIQNRTYNNVEVIVTELTFNRSLSGILGLNMMGAMQLQLM